MSTHGEQDFGPLFVVGAERSGTTLLAGLLGRHSRIAATPETHFLYGPHSTFDPPVFIGNTHEELLEGLFTLERMPDLDLDRDRLMERFRRYEAEPRFLVRAALEEYAAMRDKPFVAEKSPHHLFHVPLILEWYPAAKVICVVRDGRDVALSLVKAPWTHEDLWKHAAKWNLVVRKGLEFERRFPKSFLTLQFEALLRCPEEEMTRILGFAGLDFEEGQLDHEIDTFVVPEWEEEWKGKAKGPIDVDRIGAWKGTASPEQVWTMNAVMGPYLSRLGYGDTAMRGCPPWRRAATAARAAAYRAAYTPALYPVGRWLEQRVRKRP